MFSYGLVSHIWRLRGSWFLKIKLVGGHGSIHLCIAQNVFFSSYYHCTTNKMWPSTSHTCLNPQKKLIETCVSFRQFFCDKEKKEGVKGKKGFLLEKTWPKLPHYEGKRKSKVTILK